MRIKDVKIGMKVVLKGCGAGWCTDARKCVGKTFTIDSRAHAASNEFGFKEVQWYFNCADFEPAYALEVGCKVRVVEHLYEGSEGIVNSLPNSLSPHVQFGNYFMEPKYLIVLEPAPKKSEVDLFMDMMKADISNYCGIDFASDPVYGTIHAGKWNKFIMKHGGNSMENNEKKYKELAERMKDEYVGFDTTKTLARQSGTVFLKKAGECTIERRDVTMTLTVDDIETLLKQKGITKALGVHEIEAYSGTYTVGIIKFVPIKKDKFTEANEAV